MRNSHFDPFGELETERLEQVSGGARLFERAGIGIFWGLVVTIVAARAVLFDAGLEQHLRYAASFFQALITAIV